MPVAGSDGTQQASQQVTALRRTLHERGLRMTPQRQLVLDAVRALGHATPEQVCAQVQEKAPAVNITTVYRSLDLLERLGVVRHTHLGHGAPTYSVHEHEHVHLVCHGCGAVTEVATERHDAASPNGWPPTPGSRSTSPTSPSPGSAATADGRPMTDPRDRPADPHRRVAATPTAPSPPTAATSCAEQRAMTRTAAVVDRSHRGVLAVPGDDRLSWLHLLLTQHVERPARRRRHRGAGPRPERAGAAPRRASRTSTRRCGSTPSPATPRCCWTTSRRCGSGRRSSRATPPRSSPC